MAQRTHFGVLEVAWEMSLPGPAGDAPRRGDLLPNEGLDQLPFEPNLLHGLPGDVVARHTRFVKKLSEATEPSGRRERVPVPVLVTQYEFPDRRILMLSQYIPPTNNTVVYRVAAGMTRQVDVGELAGLYIQGRWFAEGGATTAHWEPTGGATLLWSEGEHAFELYGEGFTAEEMLHFASGLQ